MKQRQNYQQPDLDSIEELNYISTIEEDAIIDAHIVKLREWGYGSISQVNDLHQLFWEITRRGISCDKLFRVAVVECIDEDSLYTKFLGMAKRFNGWSQKLDTQGFKEKKAENKKLKEKTAEVDELKESLMVANANISRLEKELKAMLKSPKAQSEAAIENALRAQLKKEYSKKLMELRTKTKSFKTLYRALMSDLNNPCSRLFGSFDFTKEKDVDEYVEWFQMAGRKIKMPTQKIILDQYKDGSIPYFVKRVTEYNELWEQSHIEEEAEDD